MLDGHGQGGLAFEGDAPRDHLEEDDAHGVKVRAGVDVAGFDLLGGHVLRGAEHDARAGHAFGFEETGKAEIHDPGASVAVDHDVLGFQIAVDDAHAVGFGQPFGDLAGDGDGPAGPDRARPADELLEVFALDVLHADELDQAGLAQVVEAADVAVGDLAGVLELGLEPLHGGRVEAELRPDDLESHHFLELLVKGFVNRTHAALAQLLDDLVAPGEDRAPVQLVESGDQGRRIGRRRSRGRRLQRRRALTAETAVVAVIRMALGASHEL